MTSRGKLYGVSVGPGDPELLTLKAVRLIKEADIIAAPNIGHKRQTALNIVREYIGDKELMDCSTPMLRDRAQVERAYDELADRLAAVLDQGKTVSYICLGDIGVYATYYYLHNRLVERGYDCEVIAGVTSFSAAAAALGVPLCLGPERLEVIPVIKDGVDNILATPGTKVFMKTGKELPQLKEALRSAGCLDRASMVANCGLEDEQVFSRLADVPEDMTDYFTLVILRES